MRIDDSVVSYYSEISERLEIISYPYKENLVEESIMIIKSHLMELDEMISIWNEVQ